MILENDCFYVGVSYEPHRRISKHLKGKSKIAWLEKHPPKELMFVLPIGLGEPYAKYEDSIAYMIAEKKGIAKVRGGLLTSNFDDDECAILIKRHNHKISEKHSFWLVQASMCFSTYFQQLDS